MFVAGTWPGPFLPVSWKSRFLDPAVEYILNQKNSIKCCDVWHLIYTTPINQPNDWTQTDVRLKEITNRNGFWVVRWQHWLTEWARGQPNILEWFEWLAMDSMDSVGLATSMNLLKIDFEFGKQFKNVQHSNHQTPLTVVVQSITPSHNNRIYHMILIRVIRI